MFDLSGKSAIVTGAGMGIGKGIALRLAEAGAGIRKMALRYSRYQCNEGWKFSYVEGRFGKAVDVHPDRKIEYRSPRDRRVRPYEETAFFGEVSYDFSDQFTASASVRSFEYEARLDGFSGTVWWPCGGFAPGHPDNNYGEGGCSASERLTKGDDQVFRVSLDYALNDDSLVYITWGEGYRPGSLNRMCETRVLGGLGNQGQSNIGCAACVYQ